MSTNELEPVGITTFQKIIQMMEIAATPVEFHLDGRKLECQLDISSLGIVFKLSEHKESLDNIKVYDCEFSLRLASNLFDQYGPEVTLGQLDKLTDDQLFRTPHFGRKSVKEIRACITTVKSQLGIA